MSKSFCCRLPKFTFTKFLLENFWCTLSAPGDPPPKLYIYTTYANFENAAQQTFKKISYSKGHDLETVIFLMIAARLKFICHIQAKQTWAGLNFWPSKIWGLACWCRDSGSALWMGLWNTATWTKFLFTICHKV